MIIALRHSDMMFDLPLIDEYRLEMVSIPWSGEGWSSRMVSIPDDSGLTMKPFLVRVDPPYEARDAEVWVV